MTAALRFALGLTLLALPLVEIALLIKAAALLGLWTVVAIVILTAIAGILVIRAAGLSAVSRMFSKVQSGGSPVQSLLDQFLAVTGGVLLILPGLLGDAAGVMLLLPPVRRAVIRSMASWLTFERVSVRTRQTEVDASDNRYQPRTTGEIRPGQGTVIEGEYERLDDDEGSDLKR